MYTKTHYCVNLEGVCDDMAALSASTFTQQMLTMHAHVSPYMCICSAQLDMRDEYMSGIKSSCKIEKSVVRVNMYICVWINVYVILFFH